jgi:hypothetical protein
VLKREPLAYEDWVYWGQFVTKGLVLYTNDRSKEWSHFLVLLTISISRMDSN